MKNKQTSQIYFGEVVEGYDIRVLNEREARAGAGLLFLFGFISFTNAYLLHDFTFTKIFVTIFMLDFIVRIFINPKFSPSLLLGRVFIQNQIPEYVAAPQKRWAWFIGLYLSIVMFLLIVVFNIMTPIKIFICILCLLLLFSEAAFGICIGCKIFNIIYKENPKLCPGGVCEIRQKDEIQKFSSIQRYIVIFTVITIIGIATLFIPKDKPQETINETQTKTTIDVPINQMKCSPGKCGGSSK